MPDEYIQITPGDGPGIAVDQVDQDRAYQIVKIGVGADGAQPAHVSDANPMPITTPDGVTLSVNGVPDTPLGNKSLSMTGAAVALSTVSGGIPSGAKRFLFVPDVDVHYTDDGSTTPSSTVGIPVGTGQAWVISVADFSTVEFYGASGGTVRGGFYS